MNKELIKSKVDALSAELDACRKKIEEGLADIKDPVGGGHYDAEEIRIFMDRLDDMGAGAWSMDFGSEAPPLMDFSFESFVVPTYDERIAEHLEHDEMLQAMTLVAVRKLPYREFFKISDDLYRYRCLLTALGKRALQADAPEESGLKVTFDIPDEFVRHWLSDRFESSLARLCADAHLLAGNYEKETARMLIRAFRAARTGPSWVRVSDRLPEEKGIYTVLDRRGDTARYVFTGTGSSRDYWKRCVTAWDQASMKRY